MNGKIVVVFIVIGTAILATGLTLSGLRPADPHGCYGDLPRATSFPFNEQSQSLNGTLQNTTLFLQSIGDFHVTIDNETIAMQERPYEGTWDGERAVMECEEHRIELRVTEGRVDLEEFSQY